MGVLKKRAAMPLAGIFAILGTFFFLLDPSHLPDYDSYERIYINSQLGGEWEIFFVAVNFYFLQSEIPYSSLRNFILVFSSLALFLLLSRLKPIYQVKTVPLLVVNLLLMFFILAVLVFEYFVVRIRAGFAMGMIFYGIFFLMSRHVLLGLVWGALFFVMAFFTHQSTTVILTVLIASPFLAAIWVPRIPYKKNLYTLLSAILIAYLIYTLNMSYELRGEHIFSPLNPVRFVMISFVPLVLLFLIKNEFSTIFNKGYFLADFPFYFVLFYIILAIALAFIFFNDLTAKSGEALVRLYTLTSIPALLSVHLSGSVLRAPVSTYILLVNGLFFLVTIFFPG